MEELWKSIKGFKNYEVSNKGRFRSLTRKDSNNNIKKDY